MKTFRVCIPMYWGQLGCVAYPNPLGFPLRVPQNVVFGDPIVFEQSDNPEKEVVAHVFLNTRVPFTGGN